MTAIGVAAGMWWDTHRIYGCCKSVNIIKCTGFYIHRHYPQLLSSMLHGHYRQLIGSTSHCHNRQLLRYAIKKHLNQQPIIIPTPRDIILNNG